MAQSGGPVKIHLTGKSAFPGDPAHAYVMTAEPRASILQRAVSAIGNLFINLLPDKGGRADVSDDSLIIKTSPVLWEYEVFRQNWERRSVLRSLDELMREDPRVKRANRVFAATAVRKGFTVTVSSTANEALAEQAQDVVNQVMRDCQINAKLASWARIILKEGDLFLNPVVDVQTLRLKNIKRLPAISMERMEDMTGNFQDLDKAFRQIDPITLDVIEEFPLWAINHIRYDHEEGAQYGNSQYLQLLPFWRKLKMTEEDLVVRRRTRAPMRRLHSVGNKEHPGDWSMVADYKAKNQLDAARQQVATDYFGNGLTDIKTLEGDGHLDEIKDVEHLQEVYMIGTGVPLHILGFGRNVNRDIVDNQERQFREDTQELRDLLEFGDASTYSGLRFIFDFALALQGIDPTLVEYNFGWYADDNESPSDRVERIIKLREAKPRPLISHRLALQTISRDLNLETNEAVDGTLREIEEELAQSRQDQEALRYALNPSDVRVTRELTDAARAAGKKKVHPLRTARVARLEARLAATVRRQLSAVLKAARPELRRLGEKHAHLTDDAHRETLVRDVLEVLGEALTDQREARARTFIRFYRTMAKRGRADAMKDAGRVVTDAPRPRVSMSEDEDYVNPETVRYLRTLAGERIYPGEAELRRIRGLDDTTLDELRKQLSRAYRNGEEWPEWIRRIEQVMQGSVPRGRAEMIARTELAWAYSTGLFATYREIGVERVVWLAVIDNRTCERCAENHERTFRLAEAEHMIPLHPRCRCTTVAAAGSYD